MIKEIIGDATLYLGDCMEVMPTLDKVDAVVTDPPYGIGIDGNYAYRKNKDWQCARKTKDYGVNEWDKEPPSKNVFDAIISLSDNQIIWGGNHFELYPNRGWLVWDKKVTGDFSDCELAWTSLDMGVRRIYHLWSGYKKEFPEERYHPTQKPINVMEWAIRFIDAETILDPFMGSGTTGVACMNLGRKFIGIEIDEKYFEIACKRISDAQKQGKLFEPEKKKAEQVNLF